MSNHSNEIEQITKMKSSQSLKWFFEKSKIEFRIWNFETWFLYWVTVNGVYILSNYPYGTLDPTPTKKGTAPTSPNICSPHTHTTNYCQFHPFNPIFARNTPPHLQKRGFWLYPAGERMSFFASCSLKTCRIGVKMRWNRTKWDKKNRLYCYNRLERRVYEDELSVF